MYRIYENPDLIVDMRNGLKPKASSQWLRAERPEMSAVWIRTVREHVFAWPFFLWH